MIIRCPTFCHLSSTSAALSDISLDWLFTLALIVRHFQPTGQCHNRDRYRGGGSEGKFIIMLYSFALPHHWSSRFNSITAGLIRLRNPRTIGLYRDVWIAAIASSRTSLATLTVVMCNTSQWKLSSLRNSGMLNEICIVTYYTLRPLESLDSFWIAMAFSR